MIEERARIIDIQSDSVPPLAALEVQRTSACGLCGQTSGCGNKVWGKLFNHRQGRFFAENNIAAQIGDTVIVEIDERSVMFAALLLYLLPVVLMLVLSALAQAWWDSQLAALVGAITGLSVPLLWIKGFLAARPHGFARPQIVRRDNAHCVTFQ